MSVGNDVPSTILVPRGPSSTRLRTAAAILLVGLGLFAVFVATLLIVRFGKLSDLLDYQLQKGREAANAGNQVAARSLAAAVGRTLDDRRAVANVAVWSVVVALVTLTQIFRPPPWSDLHRSLAGGEC